MNWLLLCAFVFSMIIVFRQDARASRSKAAKARLRREEARIARNADGPFAHRSPMTLVEDYAAGQPMMGAKVSPDDLRGDATYLFPPSTSEAGASRRVFSTTWTARLLTPVFFAACFWAGLYFGVPDGKNWTDYSDAVQIISLMLGYSVVFVWVFRVDIEGDTLRIRMPWFAMRRFKLSDIQRIHDDGPLFWRVVMSDGQRPQVLKMVVGADELRQILAKALEANTR